MPTLPSGASLLGPGWARGKKKEKGRKKEESKKSFLHINRWISFIRRRKGKKGYAVVLLLDKLKLGRVFHY